MKLCDRCRVSGCLLNYGGKACQDARKRECPDVVFTRADKIREISDDELVEIITRCLDDGGKGCCERTPNKRICTECCREWLQEPVEVL